jgi:hypothetical protein
MSTNPGNGSTAAPPNATQAYVKVNSSTLISNAQAEIRITGNCLTLAENGLQMGIYQETGGETTQYSVRNILYSYRYLGVQG